MTKIIDVQAMTDLPKEGDPLAVYHVASVNETYRWSMKDHEYVVIPMLIKDEESRRVFRALVMFAQNYNQIAQGIGYDLQWSDGAGGHGPAVKGPYAPKINPGEIVKSISPGNRRLIFVGTCFGNIVLADRYNSVTTEFPKNYVMYEAPTELDDVMDFFAASGKATVDVLKDVLGVDRENLGTYLENVLNAIQKAKAK